MHDDVAVDIRLPRPNLHALEAGLGRTTNGHVVVDHQIQVAVYKRKVHDGSFGLPDAPRSHPVVLAGLDVLVGVQLLRLGVREQQHQVIDIAAADPREAASRDQPRNRLRHVHVSNSVHLAQRQQLSDTDVVGVAVRHEHGAPDQDRVSVPQAVVAGSDRRLDRSRAQDTRAGRDDHLRFRGEQHQALVDRHRRQQRSSLVLRRGNVDRLRVRQGQDRGSPEAAELAGL